MWHCTKASGNCTYSDRADDTDVALRRGMSLEAAALEIRRSKSAIQKILILDRYVEFVKAKRGRKLHEEVEADPFLRSLKDIGFAWNDLFGMTLTLFVELCRKKNYKAFVKENKAIGKFKLASILGLREAVLKKVSNRSKSFGRKKKPIAVVINQSPKR